MDKISIIFPIYKEGKALENIKKISEDPYPNKEFILTVDCPTESFLKKLEEIKKYKNVKVFISKERRGKVASTNEAVKKASGNILIFLDSDVEVRKIDLKKIADACKKYELVDFIKIIKPIRFWGKLMYVEYFVYRILLWFLSKIKKSIFLNGAGFAIRKEIWEKLGGYQRMVIEDMDLATRIYLNNGKYHLLEDVILEIEPVNSIRKWIDQRKRWLYGGLEWFLTYPKEIIRYFIKYPLALLILLTIVNPAILLFFILSFFPYRVLYELGLQLLILLSSNISPILFFIIPIKLLISLIKALLFLILLIVLLIIIYYIFAIKFKVKLNPLWVIGFVLIYSPFYILLAIIIILYYLIFERPPKFSWKV